MLFSQSAHIKPGPVSEFTGKRILIIGATGNLGNHVALQIARSGGHLSLWGRNLRSLEDLASSCRAHAVTVTCRSVELSDIGAALAALREEDNGAPFDCAFFMAGIGDTREAGRKIESAELVTRHGLVNFIAPAALSAELGERMARRRSGRIALVGTAAATHPLPMAAGYTSSKCGLSHFAEAMRLALKPHGVTVTLVSPGFFTPADENAYAYARPGQIPVEVVARRLVTATARGRSELVTPWWFVFLRWVGKLMPRPLRDRVLARLPSP